MLGWLWTLNEIARARNAAVATIQPLVEASRSRLGGIADSVWLEPYMVGFLTMMITIAARRERRAIDEEAMCKVQAGAWQTITGLDYAVGEEIILLSEAQDAEFAAGCSDAIAMASDFYRDVMSGAEGSPAIPGPMRPDDALSGHVVALQALRATRWREVFDTYVSQPR